MDKAKPVREIIEETLSARLRELIDDAFVHQTRVFKKERYILEQCHKLYRIRDCYAIPTEYKTGWLKLKQAQGFLKLLKGNDEYDV